MSEKDPDQYTEVECPVLCDYCNRIVPLAKMRGIGSDLRCPECHEEMEEEDEPA